MKNVIASLLLLSSLNLQAQENIDLKLKKASSAIGAGVGFIILGAGVSAYRDFAGPPVYTTTQLQVAQYGCFALAGIAIISGATNLNKARKTKPVSVVFNDTGVGCSYRIR